MYFLLVFNLPTYRITPSAHPVKCPPQWPSPIHPHPPPSSPSTTPSSFPRVRSLYVLSPFLIFPTHFFSLPLYSLSLLFIFPKWMRTYNVCPSLIDLLHSALYPPVPSKLKQMVGIRRLYSIFFIHSSLSIFFIHSSFDGHRGSFHSLAIVMLTYRSGSESALELSWVCQTTIIMLFTQGVVRAKGTLGLNLQPLNPRTQDWRL